MTESNYNEENVEGILNNTNLQHYSLEAWS